MTDKELFNLNKRVLMLQADVMELRARVEKLEIEKPAAACHCKGGSGAPVKSDCFFCTTDGICGADISQPGRQVSCKGEGCTDFEPRITKLELNPEMPRATT